MKNKTSLSEYKDKLALLYSNRYKFEIQSLPIRSEYYSGRISDLGMKSGDLFKVQYYDAILEKNYSIFDEMKSRMDEGDSLKYRLTSLENDGETVARVYECKATIENIYMNYSWESDEMNSIIVVFRNTKSVELNVYVSDWG